MNPVLREAAAASLIPPAKFRVSFVERIVMTALFDT
jgi:hypothetical protein